MQERLAAGWDCEQFVIYLFRKVFELITDPNPNSQHLPTAGHGAWGSLSLKFFFIKEDLPMRLLRVFNVGVDSCLYCE